MNPPGVSGGFVICLSNLQKVIRRYCTVKIRQEPPPHARQKQPNKHGVGIVKLPRFIKTGELERKVIYLVGRSLGIRRSSRGRFLRGRQRNTEPKRGALPQPRAFRTYPAAVGVNDFLRNGQA